MSLCGLCQPAVALELHAPASRPLRTHVRVAWWGGLCWGREAGVQYTVDCALPCVVWLPEGRLLPTGCNIASISPES